MLTRFWYRLPCWFQTLVAFILILGGATIAVFLGSSDNQIAASWWIIAGVFTSGIGFALFYNIRQTQRWQALDREGRLLELKEKWFYAEIIAERMIPDIARDDEERAALDWRRDIHTKGLVRDNPLFYLKWLAEDPEKRVSPLHRDEEGA